MTHPEVLRSKFEHAEALMGQMKRVQYEQSAPSGFAEEAYEAQQAYLAQLAYDEYQAYVSKMEKGQAKTGALAAKNTKYSQSNGAQSGYMPRTNRAQQASRFVPPVHVPPAFAQRAPAPRESTGPAMMSFGDSLARQQSVQQSAVVPVSHERMAASIQRAAPPIQRPVQRQQIQARPVQRNYGSPLPLNHQQMGVRPNPTPIGYPQATAGRNQIEPSAQNKKRPYILSENGVGLQDKIASLLTKPGYGGTRNPQSRPSMSSPKKIPTLAVTDSRSASRSLVRQQDVRQADRRTQSFYSPEKIARTKRKSDGLKAYPVSRAERQSPIKRFQPNAQPVRQVALVEPDQEQVNNGFSLDPSHAVAPTQTAKVNRGQPELNQTQAAAPRLAKQTQDFRQISVLRNAQDSDDSSFQPNQVRKDAFPPQEDSQPAPFGVDRDEDIRKIDENLTRQRQGTDDDEGKLLRRDNDDEKKRLSEEMKRLEEQMDSQLGNFESDMEDEELKDDFRSGPTEKSCAEFRAQLLNNPIRDIALDISPPASSNRDQFVAISRSWTDRSGTIVATGSMVDLRRGYVIIEGVGGRQKIPYAKLSGADLAAISEYWQLPEVCTVGEVGTPSRNWIPQTYTWKASNACHKPLYFENIQLERYGHTHGPIVQPFHSTAHFFVRLATLPYHTAIHPPNECQYALGFYRPGNCAPWLKDPIPLSLNGAVRQGAAVTALSLIP